MIRTSRADLPSRDLAPAATVEEVQARARDNKMIDACPVAGLFHLGYLAFFEDAERRASTGEAQHFCGNCERWRWPDHRESCQFFEWKSVDPCPDAPKGAHHPECGRGFPEPGCHAECPTLLRAHAVLAGTYRTRRTWETPTVERLARLTRRAGR